jgi:hypothetical protein
MTQHCETQTLKHLRALAITQLGGRSIDRLVIAVPADCSDHERQRIRKAGVLGGMEVLRIINAPWAACAAHKLDKLDQIKKAVVFDLGASALRVSVLEIEEGIYDLLATGADSALGWNSGIRKQAVQGEKNKVTTVLQSAEPLVSDNLGSKVNTLRDDGSNVASYHRSVGAGVLDGWMKHTERVLEQAKASPSDIDFVSSLRQVMCQRLTRR